MPLNLYCFKLEVEHLIYPMVKEAIDMYHCSTSSLRNRMPAFSHDTRQARKNIYPFYMYIGEN